VSTGKYFTPQLLGRFLKSHPGVTLKLSVNNREVMLRELANNEVDLAITGRPPEDLDVVAVPFARHPHVIVAAADHPLAEKKRIPLARVAEEPFLMREQGSGTRGLLERLFAAHGHPLKVGMEMPSNETIKQAAMAGMGVSFLSLHTIALELETKRLAVLDVVGLPIVRDWYVVHLGGKRLSPVAEALKRFLVDEAAKHLGGQEAPRRRRSAAEAQPL
jgi:DNA-binding transcriptional LysR family regulator